MTVRELASQRGWSIADIWHCTYKLDGIQLTVVVKANDGMGNPVTDVILSRIKAILNEASAAVLESGEWQKATHRDQLLENYFVFDKNGRIRETQGAA